MNSEMDWIDGYFRSLESSFNELYELASKAKARGVDPSLEPEVKPARDIAARVEGMTGLEGVGERIKELLKEASREEAAFKIAEEVVYGRFCQFSSEEEAADRALRVALALLTESVTAAPIEGVAGVKIKSNPDGTSYLAIYYAGPIRSAGGTEQAASVLVADFIRRLLHLDRYKPSEEEVERYVEEVDLYERHVAHLQYPSTPQEVKLAARNLPVEVTGEPTDPFEVSGHRNLNRVETNQLRGGAILVLNDGILGKAKKIKKIVERLGITGWEWISELGKSRDEKKEKRKEEAVAPSEKYLSDVVAGRPILAMPSAAGGFRLRYGRSRNTGLAAVGIHPATMILLNGFLAPGTHIRMERPGKGAVVMPVDSIEGPIVRLKDGSVVKVESLQDATELASKVEKVLFLGDILIGFGEFLENNHLLLPSGICEEWWVQEVYLKVDQLGGLKHVSRLLGLSEERLGALLEKPFEVKPTAQEALIISKRLKVPLHPRYTYNWQDVDIQSILELKEYVERFKVGSIIRAPVSQRIKQLLEILGIPHRVEGGDLVLGEEETLVLSACLAAGRPIGHNSLLLYSAGTPNSFVTALASFPVKPKATVYIGARMGRPEKADKRTLNPPVHVLFPVELKGGRERDILRAATSRAVNVEVSRRRCPECGEDMFNVYCRSCGCRTVQVMSCPKCGLPASNGRCLNCGAEAKPYSKVTVDLKAELAAAMKSISMHSPPRSLKGVKGLSSATKLPEPLEKGLLRAKYELYVYKDGTVRFDATDAPLTHFTPKEVSVPVEKLRELGYTHDYKGVPLTEDSQILELKPQDVVIPFKCASYFVKVAKFVDELLVKFYGQQPYYNVEKEEDLVGHLVIGLAPHTSAGILGRIIGFTRANVCLAHPYWHAAKRRNCDGDEDAVMLALDVLLNFSKAYLPEKRGGMMDTPLIVTVFLNPSEVDSEAHNLDVGFNYPLEFYHATYSLPNPDEQARKLDIVAHRLGTPKQYYGLGFTHPTTNITGGPETTSYKKLKKMSEKIEAQLSLASKIRAVTEQEVAEKILQKHIVRDVVGNLKAFTTQSVRCLNCNKKYRRPPLKGTCLTCGGKLVLTVHQATIEKYLPYAVELIQRYNLKPYIVQRVKLLQDTLNLLFQKNEKQKQLTLTNIWNKKF
ncbi:MAG: DNA polymerase II large subunit [Candidatus Freyarchaeota archaeon]|nr:DNA polymerase II large subunit [Candidatus Jordarchaeia archaeon]